jgi:hypothetical protein
MLSHSSRAKSNERAEAAAKKSLYLCAEAGTLQAVMTDSNLNIWGELVVPIGLIVCFGPALALWALQEIKAPKEDDGSRRAPDKH